MYSLYKDFSEVKVTLAYFGIFNDGITELLIDLSESYVAKTGHLSKLSRKASYLIAESFQNIVRHGIVEKSNISEIRHNRDFFQISIFDDRISVASVNVIENKYVAQLNESIDYINTLDNNELKKLSNDILKYGEISEKGGAGVGLVEIVRRSGLPLKKQFVTLNTDYSKVILYVEIPINEELKTHKVDIQSVIGRYESLIEMGVLFLYKGDFSGSSNANLIEMLHSNFVEGIGLETDKTKNIIASIEMLQNVSKHGHLVDGHREGLFTLSNVNGGFYIECCNFINPENYELLKNNLQTIKASSIEEIEKTYKNRLVNSYLSEDSNAGLGLLEIARFTKNNFTYKFEETNSNEIFYSIKIKIV